MNDYDFVAAATPAEALSFYMNLTGLTRAEALGEGMEEPLEVDDKRMGALVMWDEDTDKESTFKEYLGELLTKGAHFPQIFASSEY